MEYPARKFVFTGDFGCGKTSLSMTFPPPILVFLFDNVNKAEWPVEQVPGAVDVTPWKTYDGSGVQWQKVKDKDGKMLVFLESYKDLDPTEPQAWMAFQQHYYDRVRKLGKPKQPEWKTWSFDSVSQLMLYVQKDQKYRVNPGKSKEANIEMTEVLEELLSVTVPGLPMNVILNLHIDHRQQEIQGTTLHIPVLPGRMKSRMFAQYSEVYRLWVDRTGDGELVRRVQTHEDEQFFAMTGIDAPNNCEPTYEKLWSNWAAKKNARKAASA